MAKAAKTTKSRGRTASGSRRGDRYDVPAVRADGKHLVIVESPTKAKTINKYLGAEYVVMASVGHVRDLPASAPKGSKRAEHPVPGVDLKHDFRPTYEVLPEKEKTVKALRQAAKKAADVWFATDLDREGEAIAWHLAHALAVPLGTAKRVVFNAITKTEIQNAFAHPRHIDENRVNAQQARRILDRIVGYQVSPLLWKKVAAGLSAGRVQSVAARLVVEREREIEAFLPEEYWRIAGYFATDLQRAPELAAAWREWIAAASKDEPRTLRERLAWLSERKCLRAELAELGGKPVELKDRHEALRTVQMLGFKLDRAEETEDPKGKGPARNLVVYHGSLANPPAFSIRSIQTKRVTTRPPAPFITSTMQQTASTRLSFPLQRTMRIAQQLYEGIDLKGMGGQTGLITYMRTDSTHLSGEALSMARGWVEKAYGPRYLPEKPNFFASSNKAAQEAHEAIRPTDVTLTPEKVKAYLSEEQHKLYRLIWERFVACQMTPAEWDSTTVLIDCRAPNCQATFKATGRTLAFDGFYKVTGVPGAGEEAILPPLKEQQPLAALQVDPTQHFTSPPPRYTEASLQKKLEEEGIGRPSTYAAIIQTIQDREYVQQLQPPRDRRLFATDLGKVVTDKLTEGFPKLMDVGYTRQMEAELDKIEDEHLDWVRMLHEFYGPFKERLDEAYESMSHAKAQTDPAPFPCPKCGSQAVYRFGKHGKFLTCSKDREQCDFRASIDREGNPVEADQLTDVLCPFCGSGLTKRVGRFGAFLGCVNYPKCKGIVNLDRKKGTVVPPKVPPFTTDVPCSKCDSPLNLRRSARGPWLSCSKFPKCRGRMAWSALEEGKQAELEQKLAEHEKANPVPTVRSTDGRVISDGHLPQVNGGPQGDTGGASDADDQAGGTRRFDPALDSDAA